MGCAWESPMGVRSKGYVRNDSLDALSNTAVTKEWRRKKKTRVCVAALVRLRRGARVRTPGFCGTLFRLRDHRAGDTRRRGAGSARGDRVDDHGGSSIAEHRMVVASECDVGGHDAGMCCTVSGHDQRKIRDVACRKSRVVGVVAVLGPAGVEVGSGRLEV